MPNRHKSIGNTDETLLSRYEETEARLKKIENAGYTVISIWGCQFRNLLRQNPGLENELSAHPYVKISPINIRDALYGVEPRPQKHIAKLNRKKKSTMWMLSVSIPTFVSMGNFL